MNSSIFLAILFIFLVSLLKNKFLTIILFVPLFFYFFTFDIRHSVEIKDLQVYNKVGDYNNYIFYGIIILWSVVIVLLYDNQLLLRLKNKRRIVCQFNRSKLLFCFYFTSLLSLFGTVINLSHVDFSFEILFQSPREFELLFGSSTFINYLYFLSPISICIYLFLAHFNIKIYCGKIIIFILFFSSLFHGVKFTVFDTVLIPTFFYFYLNDTKINFKIPILIFIILFIFYWAFSTFIRGAEDSDKTPLDQVFSYVIPNYVNLAYSLNQKILQWDGFSILVPDKSPSLLNSLYVLTEGGFVLNDSYNMETGYISYYRFAWYFGPLLFLAPVIVWRRYLISLSKVNIISIFLIAMIDYCLLFTFFFHAFVKIKYWYFVFVVYLINFLINKKVKINNEKNIVCNN